jgi:hypothetical protein
MPDLFRNLRKGKRWWEVSTTISVFSSKYNYRFRVKATTEEKAREEAEKRLKEAITFNITQIELDNGN